MGQFAYPSQTRYNDLYQARVFSLETEYKHKYLSRVANNVTKVIGDNILLKGLNVTPTFNNSIINLSFSPGILVHDSTLIKITAPFTLTCDVAVLGDTPTTNSHLGVFTNFQYIESPDVDSQTKLSCSVYHIDSVGTPTAFSGSPEFSVTRNKLLITGIDFTKSGSNVIECSEMASPLTADESKYLTVLGVNYHIRGIVNTNINFWDIYNTWIHSFLLEFLFQDNTRI